MKLEHYFRLIVISLFQGSALRSKVDTVRKEKMSYDNTYFYCPKVVCNDGFTVSLQIHHGNYCESNEGYRTLGHTWERVEFGFPSENEPLMFEYAESYGYGGYDDEGNEIPFDIDTFDITNSVGSIPLEVMEKVCEKHGGINWDATLSVDVAKKFIES